jgi:hypothetical protein
MGADVLARRRQTRGGAVSQQSGSAVLNGCQFERNSAHVSAEIFKRPITVHSMNTVWSQVGGAALHVGESQSGGVRDLARAVVSESTFVRNAVRSVSEAVRADGLMRFRA